MARLGKKDWIDEGLSVLTESGYEGIKIDRLCKRLNISIGSFYHHFKNIDDYIEKMILEWETRSYGAYQAILEHESGPEFKLERLYESTMDMPPKLEVAIRAWSFQNDFIGRSVDKIDKRRVKLLVGLFSEMGYDIDMSKSLAEVNYSSYLGIITYCTNRSRGSARKLIDSHRQMFDGHLSGMKSIPVN